MQMYVCILPCHVAIHTAEKYFGWQTGVQAVNALLGAGRRLLAPAEEAADLGVPVLPLGVPVDEAEAAPTAVSQRPTDVHSCMSA